MGATSKQSKVGTVIVATIPAMDIGAFYGAPDDAEIRLFIRNTGAVDVLLAYDSSVLNGAIVSQGASDRFPLLVGQDVVFILAPRQYVFAVAIGTGGQLAYHASPALPILGGGR